MARARNIKPGFFTNEELVELDFSVRLLFIGLWTLADREGRLEDRPKKIKMALFPADNIDVDLALSELESHEFLVRYSVDENQYIQILNFTKHQNPHVKEPASIIPAPCEHHASTVQATLIPDSPLLIPDSRDSRADETGDDEKPKPATAGPILLKTYLEQCKEQSVKPLPAEDTVFDFAETAGIPVEFIQIAWEEFKAKHLENGKRQKDWRQTFRNCVRSNWYKVWFKDANGDVLLTSQGRTLEQVHGLGQWAKGVVNG